MEQELQQQEQPVPDLSLSPTWNKTFTKTLVNKKEQLDDLIDTLQYDVAGFAFDVETNGQLDKFKTQLVGISFGINQDNEVVSYYVPMAHYEGEQIAFDYILEQISGVIENPSTYKVVHNLTHELKVLRRYHIEIGGDAHDTSTMAWLLDETRTLKQRKLKLLAEEFLGADVETYEDVMDSVKLKKGTKRDYNFARVDLEHALPYAAADSYYTMSLFNVFKKMMEEEKVWNAYYNVEMPVNRTIANIIDHGIYIDQDAVKEADKKLPEVVETVESRVYEEAGEVFNIASGKQLGPILFEKLGIGNDVPVTKTGQYKTDKKTLEFYAAQHPIIEDILQRKKVAKIHEVFVQGLEGFLSKDGRIHPNFNGSGTVTGRLACSKPNMQQVAAGSVEGIKPRNFFKPEPGNLYIASDYSQIELRILAHFSGDKELTEAFLAGDVDFHEEVARRMFNVRPDQKVSRTQRVVAKTLNFGVGYGRGPKSIAEQLGISQEKAQEFIADWFKKFQGVGVYQRHVVKQARENGYIRTLSGKKRRLLPHIRSDNWKLRGNAERQAFNTKIQGSAADLIKIAMVSLEPILKEKDASMVIQIHDELVVEAPEDQAEEVKAIVKEVMELPLNGKNPLRVPISTDPMIVSSWGDAKD